MRVAPSLARWAGLALTLVTNVALAQDPSERAAGFRAVEGANVEDVPGGMLLIAAYAVAWVLVLGFVWRMWGLQKKAREDLDRVERALAERSGEGG
ncbi:MAG: hypothetical protein AAGH15_21195 [Myxococcota bacterium]